MDANVIKELKKLILKQIKEEDLETKLSIRDLLTILDMLLFLIPANEKDTSKVDAKK